MQACPASFADFTAPSIEMPRAESPVYMQKFMQHMDTHPETCADCKASRLLQEGYASLAKWEDTVADGSFH
eukprot:11724244-Prorocentrum_lima.AAC.1